MTVPAVNAHAESVVAERDLVARIKSGDVAAFERMYADTVNGLLAFAFQQVRSREIAEELVQELFLNIWKYRGKWVVTRSLKSYLFTALRNRITSYRRTMSARHELRQSTDDDPAGLTAFPGIERTDDRVRESELIVAIKHAIASLPPRCRETFLLVRGNGLSHAEAAEILGVSPKAVEMNMVRAFAALRRRLTEWT